MQGEEEKGPQAKRARVENDAKSSSETIADLDNTQREAEIEATMRAEFNSQREADRREFETQRVAEIEATMR
jgi:hypothetical protein